MPVVDRVTVVPGEGRPAVEDATVVVDDAGIVTDIRPGGEPATSATRTLVPAAVDLHLDNLRERRRPRATVTLDIPTVVAALDAECAAAGIGLVCIAARCEDAPAKGVVLDDAVRLAEAVERMGPGLACDWRLHVRVEVTDPGATEALERILHSSSRVALVSVMEHSAHRHRFPSPEEHRRFYAEDWGMAEHELDALLDGKGASRTDVDARRRVAARLAAEAGVVLASHDDRSPADVDEAAELGATVAEFPLTVAAARRARELGMRIVLGAPNAVRGRSTSSGNLLAAEAAALGLCDVLCSDYLPSALQAAPPALSAAGVLPLAAAVDLVSTAPAAALGLAAPRIAVGAPLDAALRATVGGAPTGLALWRRGHLVWSRSETSPSWPPSATAPPPAVRAGPVRSRPTEVVP
jgi:alpha-D-ribose 1-methylphosphonate 5-triphosphate diphosphatase